MAVGPKVATCPERLGMPKALRAYVRSLSHVRSKVFITSHSLLSALKTGNALQTKSQL